MLFRGETTTYIGGFPDVVSALLVLDELVVLGLAAAEGHAAGLPRAHRLAAAVEVDVLIPVLSWLHESTYDPPNPASSHRGSLDAAALQLLLDGVP